MKFRRALKNVTSKRGGQSAMANYLSVNRSTVSRWVNGQTRPSKETRREVKEFAKSLGW